MNGGELSTAIVMTKVELVRMVDDTAGNEDI
jgi:hypothetical protein